MRSCSTKQHNLNLDQRTGLHHNARRVHESTFEAFRILFKHQHRD
jgi:hypothetical protein